LKKHAGKVCRCSQLHRSVLHRRLNCSNSCRQPRRSAKPSSGASISTRARNARGARGADRFIRLAKWLHRLPRGGSGLAHAPSKAHHSMVPRHAAYDLKKLRGKDNRPPNRPHSPLRAVADRSPGDDGAPRPARQSHQNPCSLRLSHSARGADRNNPKPIDRHYAAIQNRHARRLP